jgi:diacylglycerol kinase (ATP)
LTEKKKILFIINPVSGIGKQKRVESSIPELLDHSLFDPKVAYTEYPQHAVQLSKEAADQGFELVVAVGGDGSVNEVAQGIVNTNVAMGIIPAGSGNGLAHHLKIPGQIKGAIEIINRTKIIKIDTATFNEKVFISMAGVGFDALVAERYAQVKRRGFFPYFKLVVGGFIKYHPARYTIRFDNKDLSCKALLINFANSGQFGYNATIAPSASLTDGLIDLCILHDISVLKALMIAHKLFLKNIDSSRYVEVHKVKEAEISCEQAVSSHIDGDPSDRITHAVVKIKPQSLNIIIP